jgi:DNA-directed RNA polymerase subunit RPC12/RpoP
VVDGQAFTQTQVIELIRGYDMALSPISYTCRSCSKPVEANPKRTFLGFQRVACPNCQHVETFPLAKWFRVTYIVIVVLIVLTMLMALTQGEIGYPGGIGVLVIAALIIDASLKKKTKPLLP